MDIEITVQNKIATLFDPYTTIVCGNSDYNIAFSFDEEWAEHRAKTARFTYNGGYTDVVFEGDKCAVPILKNTDAVFVGVFAGDLHTTTPAFINCKKSILCRGGAPQPPTEDVYSQLMAMINGGMLRGPQGEKGEKGEKGDAGVIKFKPVTSLPTEDIDSSAIYLVPIAESGEENRYTEYVYINGAWEKLGEISVQVDHSEYVKFTDIASDSKVGVVKVSNYRGMKMLSGGIIAPIAPTDAQIDNRNNNGDVAVTTAVTLSKFDTALVKALTDGQLVLTDEDKAKACETIGTYKRINGTSGNAYVPATIGGDNTETHYRVSAEYVNGLGAQTIPLRDAEGGLRVQEDPTNPLHAVPKQWVDGLIAELVARIEALEAK